VDTHFKFQRIPPGASSPDFHPFPVCRQSFQAWATRHQAVHATSALASEHVHPDLAGFVGYVMVFFHVRGARRCVSFAHCVAV